MDIIKGKISQATSLLDELDIDLWLIFVRETMMMADPALAMVVGLEATWESLFLFSRTGEAVALVGNFDQEDFIRSGRFSEVLTFTEGVGKDIRKLVDRFEPEKIAINYSTSNPASDGLTHGMYLLLTEYLKDTPYVERLVSSEELMSRLRSRKLPSEIELVEKAAVIADEVWHKANEKIKTGMSEIEIAALIDKLIIKADFKPSFETIVNAGDKTRPGHGSPTDAIMSPGDLLHIDFGVECEGYCSDIQRLLYFKRPDEEELPVELVDAFNMVRRIISETATLCRPGVQGCEVDQRARQMLVDNGYPEYEHALGHQLGRDVHDGGAIIGPKWERYGVTPTIPLERDNLFTLELEIILPGIGCVGLEEDVCVTEDGATFLSPRQMELIVK